MDRKSRAFAVTMGQAFHESLPALLRAEGGHVEEVHRGAVEVTVNVSFAAARSANSVQQLVWDEWPSVSVGVEPS